MISSSINLSTSTNLDVCAVVDLDEVHVHFGGGLAGPEADALGGGEAAVDLEGYVGHVLDLDGHGVEGFGGDTDDAVDGGGVGG